MSFTAHVWASGIAPIANVYEYAVLTRMADSVDDDGEGCCLSAKTIARDILADDRTVRRTLDALLERKLIGLGDQTRAAYIRADRRPVVYDLLIPAQCFGDLARTNERRAALGREPITPELRPLQDPAPADAKRKTRDDAGVKRPRKIGDDQGEQDQLDALEGADQAQHGVTDSPLVTGGLVDTPCTGGLVVQNGVTGSPARGDCQTTDPGFDFDSGSSDPNPPTPQLDTAAPAGDLVDENQGGDAPQDEQPEEPTDSERLNEAVDVAVAVRADGRGWSVHAVRRAVREALEAGRSVGEILEALPAIAADRPAPGHQGTEYPARLKHYIAAQDRAAAAAAAVEPTETLPATYGVSALTSGRPPCKTHPGHAADGCKPCVTDAQVAELEAAREKAAAAAAAAPPATPSEKAAAARAAARAAAARRPGPPRRYVAEGAQVDQDVRETVNA